MAEDGVTAQRYPLEFVVVPASRKQQLAVAASAADVNDPWTGAASGSSNSTAVRPRGWPLLPALQAMCSGCPAGWAAAGGEVNARGYTRHAHSCGPGLLGVSGMGNALSPPLTCSQCERLPHVPSWNVCASGELSLFVLAACPVHASPASCD